MSAGDDIPEDYIEAAAAVVEAARRLDEAKDEFKRRNDAALEVYKRQEEAKATNAPRSGVKPRA